MLLGIIGAIVFDALGDAYIDKNKQRNHFIESLTVLCYLCLIILAPLTDISWINIFIGYILMRISLFNIVYNLFRNLGIFYRGKTDAVYDKYVNKLSNSVYLGIIIISGISSVIVLLINKI